VAVQFPAAVPLSAERGGSVDPGGQAPPVDHLDLLKSVHHGTVVGGETVRRVTCMVPALAGVRSEMTNEYLSVSICEL